MKRFLIALQFLTILPIKIKSEIKEEDFGRSLLYFPIVGMLIGFLLSLTAFFLDFLPDLLKGVCVLITSIIITGGIHLDGFADTCDGFYGNKSKERILEIMRDSRIGVMGVIGIMSLFLFKFALIVSIQHDFLWKSLIMMATFARWSQVLACYVSSYVRKEGKAKYFVEFAGKREIFIATMFVVMVFILLMPIKGFILYLVSALPVFLFINFIKKRIGGMTGDTIGAVNEIAEVSVLFSILILGSPR